MPLMDRAVLARCLVGGVLLLVGGCSGPDLTSRVLDDGSVQIEVCEDIPISFIAFADPADDPGVGSVPVLWSMTGRSTGDLTVDAPAVPQGFDDEGYSPRNRPGPHNLRVWLGMEGQADLGEVDLGDVSGRVSEWPTVQIVRATC